MPLQNRIDPFGDIHAVEARGLFTGNRGVIHDPATKTLLTRRWKTKAWIICECEFRGRRREVMGRNARSGNAGWTELFFLDEVTALAAGHRPCFYCRRERAKEFAECYADAFGITRPRAPEIDARLHSERLAAGSVLPAVHQAEIKSLPDGTMVTAGRHAFALHRGRLRKWGFDGWHSGSVPAAELGVEARLLTPPTTVAVLQNGFRPIWHPSIGD
ncbi:MAG: hypothetical protein L0I29_15280 [Hyphomicrobiales bacterium]|nr:hypothetical protein [Hyphomicrobiales bacterium]